MALRLGLRAPEYFPRAEYFALMLCVDVFVIADTFQYSRQSFQNRTRLRTPHGSQWISIPLAGGQHGRAIRDVTTGVTRSRWQTKHWRSVEFNYRSAPFFEYYEDDIAPVLSGGGRRLADYTIGSIRSVVRHLGITASVVLASELPGTPATVSAIIESVGAKQLVSLVDTFKHDSREIPDAEPLVFEGGPYRQNFEGFQQGMSALDLLFNLGPRAADYFHSGMGGGPGDL